MQNFQSLCIVAMFFSLDSACLWSSPKFDEIHFSKCNTRLHEKSFFKISVEEAKTFNILFSFFTFLIILSKIYFTPQMRFFKVDLGRLPLSSFQIKLSDVSVAYTQHTMLQIFFFHNVSNQKPKVTVKNFCN